MDYGSMDSVLAILKKLQEVGREQAEHILDNPDDCGLSSYDADLLECMIKFGWRDRLLEVAFPQ